MVNKATIIGNLGKDPETREVNGQTVCKFSVATTEKWKDKNGEKKEETTWHNVVVWGGQAKACGDFLAKGRQVYVEGRIANRSYEKDGQTKYISEIIARDVRFLGGKSEQRESAAPADEFDGF